MGLQIQRQFHHGYLRPNTRKGGHRKEPQRLQGDDGGVHGRRCCTDRWTEPLSGVSPGQAHPYPCGPATPASTLPPTTATGEGGVRGAGTHVLGHEQASSLSGERADEHGGCPRTCHSTRVTSVALLSSGGGGQRPGTVLTPWATRFSRVRRLPLFRSIRLLHSIAVTPPRPVKQFVVSLIWRAWRPEKLSRLPELVQAA